MKIYESLEGNKCSVFMAVVNNVGRVIARHIHAGEPVSGTDAGVELRIWRRKSIELTKPQVDAIVEAVNEARDRALRSLGVTPGIRPGTVVKATFRHSSGRDRECLMLVISHENGVLCGNTVEWAEGAHSPYHEHEDGQHVLGWFKCEPRKVVPVPGRTGIEGLILTFAKENTYRLQTLIDAAQESGAPPGFMQELIAICIEQWVKNLHREDEVDHLEAAKSYATRITFAEDANAVAGNGHYPLEVRLACLGKVTDFEVIKMFLKETHSNHWAHMRADRGEEVIDWCVGVVNRAFDLGQSQLVEDARALDYMVRGFGERETDRKIAVQARLAELEAQEVKD